MKIYDRRNAPKRADTWFLYALVDSRATSEFRYIGVTNDPRRRLYRHLMEKGGQHKFAWASSVVDAGAEVLLVVLASGLTRDGAHAAEVQKIAELRESGCDLTNLTDGGEGLSGYTTHDAHRLAISKAMTGKRNALGWVPSEETRRLIGLSKVGTKRTAEARKKMSVAKVRYFEANPEAKEELAEKVGNVVRLAGLRKSNSSGFKGVYLNKKLGKWHAQLSASGGKTHIGYFPTAEEAAMAYDKAAYAAWGGDCYLNFPDRIAA